MKEDFLELIRQLKLESYDHVIVSDGSGTVAQLSSGWASFLYSKNSGEVTPFYGASSCGTNNYAEMLPVLQSLWYLDKSRKFYGNFEKICCVTDSEWMVKCANGQYEKTQNLGLWAALDFYRKIFTIDFVHVYRNTNAISTLCDAKAGKLRKGINELYQS